jgi:hypothetical protein
MVPKSLPSAHPGQTFFLPCPFSTGIDLFSFNSLIFSFPWSGAVSSDPWWEAFCIGLNQGELEEEGKRKKKKKKKEAKHSSWQNPEHRLHNILPTTLFIV